jgi:hypothetical protein
MNPSFVLRLWPVSAFTSGRFRRRSYFASADIPQEEAAKAAFSSPPRRQHRFVGDLSVRLTDRRTAGDFTGHGLGPFSPGGRRQHLLWSVADNRITGNGRIIRFDPQRFC